MTKLAYCLTVLLLVALAPNARAEALITSYYSLLGPADAFNSRGQPLDDLCTILRQDRANWHRFNKREEFDAGDPYFGSPENRAKLDGKCQYDRAYFADPGTRIRNGSRSFYVFVQVFGSNGQITRVLISEGAG